MHSRNFWPVLILKEEAMMFAKIHFQSGPKNREQNQQVQPKNVNVDHPRVIRKLTKQQKACKRKTYSHSLSYWENQKWMWGLKINQKDAFERFLAFSKRVIPNAQEKLAKELETSFKSPFMQTYSLKSIFSEQTKNIAHF